MLEALPGWVVDDAASIREEVSEWIDLTPLERWKLALRCSRDAMWAVNASGRRQTILEQVDPLPASTLSALRRLRAQQGWGDGA